MFWNTTKSAPSDSPTPSKEEAPTDQSSSEPDEVKPRSSELEAKIEQEIKFQRVNSIISGNEPLSCLQTFDQLLGCYSVSSQIKSIYRYGGLDYEACNHTFQDFKTCLSFKYHFDNSDPENDQQCFHWNLRKAEKVFEKPNSQDVWDARQIEPLELTLFK